MCEFAINLVLDGFSVVTPNVGVEDHVAFC